jgi:hypothetical protein
MIDNDKASVITGTKALTNVNSMVEWAASATKAAKIIQIVL